MTRLLFVALLAGLSACASPGRDLPPPPPTEFERPLSVQVEWSARVGTAPDTNSYRLVPAVAGDYVYTAAAAGTISAFAVDSGRRQWRTELEGHAVSAGPVVAGELLVVGTRDGQVIGLDPASGEVRWYSAASSEIMAPPAIISGVVVVRSGDGRVFGLEAATGRRLWLYERTPPVLTLRGTSSPVAGGRLALVGLDNGRLVALNPRDGSVAWEAEVATPRGRTELERMVDIDGEPALVGGEVYAASYQGRLVGASLHNGRVTWGREFSTHVGVAADRERVYAVDADSQLWAFDRFSGAAIWRQEDLRGVRLTTPVIAGDYLLAGDSAGYLNWLSPRDGELRTRIAVGRGQVRQAPVVAGDRVFVLTTGGDLAVYRLPGE